MLDDFFQKVTTLQTEQEVRELTVEFLPQLKGGFLEEVGKRLQGNLSRWVLKAFLDASGQDSSQLFLSDYLMAQFNQGSEALDEAITEFLPQMTPAFAKQLIIAAENGIADRGHTSGSPALLHIAEQILLRLGYQELMPLLWFVYSSLYIQTANLPEAREMMDRCWSLESQFPPGIPLRDALIHNEASYLQRKNRNQEAKEYVESHLPEIQDSKLKFSLRQNLAQLYLDEGRFQRAEEQFLTLLEEVEQSPIYAYKPRIYRQLGDVYHNIGSQKQAVQYWRIAENETLNTDLPYTDWSVLFPVIESLFFYHLERREKKLAEEYLLRFREEAVRLNEERLATTYGKMKARWLSTFGTAEQAFGVYQQLLRNPPKSIPEYAMLRGALSIDLYNAGEVQKALEGFEEIDRFSMGDLHKTVWGYMGLCYYRLGEQKKGLEFLERMLAADYEHRNELSRPGDQFYYSSQGEGLANRWIRLLYDVGQYALLGTLVTHFKARALNQRHSSDASAAQNLSLPEGTAFLDYYHQGELGFCLIYRFDRPEFQLVPLATQEESLSGDLATLLLMIPAFTDPAQDQKFQLTTAYQTLFEPLEAYLSGVVSLVISPAAAAHYPFHILVDRQGHYLIERFDFTYTPNAAFYRQAIQGKQNWQQGTVGYSFQAQDSSISRALFLKEAEEIAAIFQEKSMDLSGPLCLDESNCEVLLKPNQDIIHIAAHGFFDSNNPLASGISLHQGDAKILTADEVGALCRGSRLLFLNGCNTGRVERIASQESVGLMGLLFYHGIEAAILSFWPLPAEQEITLKIATSFYRFLLLDRMSCAKALQKAILENREAANPFFWGGLGLFGGVAN